MIEAYENGKKIQQRYVQEARIKIKIKESVVIMINNLKKLMERGEEFDSMEKRVEDMELDSKILVYKSMSWYERYKYNLFSCFYCKYKDLM